jgi:hypothetical protein
MAEYAEVFSGFTALPGLLLFTGEIKTLFLLQ